MDTILVSMAMVCGVTNKPGPQPAPPESPALASAAAERGQLRPMLRLNPDMDSTVIIPMVTMASPWELVSLVTPVPLLLTPTEASKALARGLLKRMLLLPKLKLHLLLQLLPFIMD